MSGTISHNHKNIQLAFATMAQFGFLSKKVFSQEMAHLSRTQQWRLWKKLLSTGYVRRYDDNYLRGYLVFTKRGRSIILNGNRYRVRPPPIQRIVHDEIVMRFAMNCESQGLIKDVQSEGVLRSKRNERFIISKGDRIEKYPDLFFSLDVPGQTVPVALEVERTRKSFQAYKSFLISYLALPGIDFVIIVCGSPAIEKAIQETATLMQYPDRSRPLVFCEIGEFLKSPSTCALKIGKETVSIADIVQSLRRLRLQSA